MADRQLTITIPTSSNFEEPQSIKEEGQGSFKIDQKLAGKKRKAEAFSDDLPTQNKPIQNNNN